MTCVSNVAFSGRVRDAFRALGHAAMAAQWGLMHNAGATDTNIESALIA